MDYAKRLNEYCDLVNEKLMVYCKKEDNLQSEVYNAMLYSLEAGGKRIRPVITLEFCRLCGGDIRGALPVACALEMIHTYSLIHDDLPAMDNDDLRRGKPTNHIVFGEALAILAGDGLLNLAFETISEYALEAGLSENQVLKVIKYLSNASGANGMIGGQVIDLAFENKKADLDTLLTMHCLKTGALFKASAVLGCICANAYEKIEFSETFAHNIGLAFQIKDDILDVEGNEKLLGKPIKSDENNHKSTFVSLLGIEQAKKQAELYTQKGKEALECFEDTGFLLWLCELLLKRDK